METALQGAKVWSSELGEFISQSHIILAGMLDDYSHGRFSLAYLPAAAQGAFGQHKPFQIQERREDGKLVPIRDLTFQEVDDPGEVMAWVAFGDIRRRGVNTVFEELEFKRITNAAIAERKQEEERADRREMMEMLASGGRDHKHFFRHNGTTFRR
jgi:hypothetical protein